MKGLYFSKVLWLSVVATLVGCSADDNQEPAAKPFSQVTGVASKLEAIESVDDIDEDGSTRSIVYGGYNGTTVFQVWDSNDAPVAYRGSELLGELSPDITGGKTTTLSGNLTGSFAPGDKFNVYVPDALFDYTGQTGSTASLSEHSFLSATATVASVDGDVVTTDEMQFVSQPMYFRFNLVDEDNKLLRVKRLLLTVKDNQPLLVESMDMLTGEIKYTDHLEVLPEKEKSTDDYPYEVKVAVYTPASAGTVYYTLLVETPDDKVYFLSDNGWSEKGQKAVNRQYKAGNAVRFYRMMQCISVESGVSTGITPPINEDVVIDDVTKEE